MKTEYRLTLKKHLSKLYSVLFSLLLILLPVYLKFNKPTSTEEHTTFVIITLLIILYNIPTLLLYFQYYRNEKGRVITYDPNQKNLIIEYKGLTTELNNDTVEEIEYCTSSNSNLRSPWRDFSYIAFNLKNGNRLVLTSLMIDSELFDIIDKINLPFPSKVTKQFWCWLT